LRARAGGHVHCVSRPRTTCQRCGKDVAQTTTGKVGPHRCA
jgi:hypothetical protein